MGLFDNMRKPVFLKESSSMKAQIEELRSMLESAPQELRAQMEQDILQLAAYLRGEEQVVLELRSSRIPMFIFRDLFLAYGSLTAQIDFLIITRGRNFIVECRSLYGEIEISGEGDFIRSAGYNGKYVKECICSPVAHNRRNLELIRKIRRQAKSNPLSRLLFDRNFYENYRSVVVMADPQTVLNAESADKEILAEIIRAGQLAEFIEKVNSRPAAAAGKEKNTERLAFSFLALQRESPMFYAEKYRQMIDGYDKGR